MLASASFLSLPLQAMAHLSCPSLAALIDWLDAGPQNSLKSVCICDAGWEDSDCSLPSQWPAKRHAV